MTSSGELTVSFAASKRVRLTAQLISVVESVSEDCSQYVLQQAESEQLVKFVVRLPKIGTYKLQAGLTSAFTLQCEMLFSLPIAMRCEWWICPPPSYSRLGCGVHINLISDELRICHLWGGLEL